MSMLAEQKRKVKWCLNPRGSLWSNDDTRFGQKLMEKMGWQKGRGLGKMENGNVDHIKMNYKNDTNGLGFDGKLSGWVAHQESFDSLLANLNSNFAGKGSDENKELSCSTHQVGSLEERAKSFKSRMHYRKFLRAKDVSQYSEKDIESIFGKKSCTSEKNEDENGVCPVTEDVSVAEKGKVNATGTDYSNNAGFMTFKSSSSIADYFSSKMVHVKENTSTEREVTKKAENSSLDDKSESCNVETVEVSMKKKQKKRKKELLAEAEPFETADVDTKPRKKKHKSLQFVDEATDEAEQQKGKNESLFKKFLKSCMKNEKVGNNVLKKSVSFSETLTQVQIIPKVEKTHKTGSSTNEELCIPADGTTAEDSSDSEEDSSDSSTSEEIFNAEDNGTATPSASQAAEKSVAHDKSCGKIEIKPNVLWLRKPFALGHLPFTQTVCKRDDRFGDSSTEFNKFDNFMQVIKNIQAHEILSTTNLLDIKGYGN